MTDSEIENWVLDTLSEGGYSFTEIVDYLCLHQIKIEHIKTTLVTIFLMEYIKIFKDGEAASFPDGLASLKSISNVASTERTAKVRHSIEITSKGLSRLNELGIEM